MLTPEQLRRQRLRREREQEASRKRRAAKAAQAERAHRRKISQQLDMLQVLALRDFIHGPTVSVDRFLTESEVATRLGIARETLTALLRAVPANLPGSPLQIRGTGKATNLTTQTRFRRRWRASSFGEWVDAVRDWQVGQMGLKPPSKPKVKGRKPKRKIRATKETGKKGAAVDWDAPLEKLL